MWRVCVVVGGMVLVGCSAPVESAQGGGEWREGAALPVRIAENAAAAWEGRVYAGGGFTPPGGSVGTWFGRLDTEGGGWEQLADLPVAVHHPGMAAADGRVWLAGGYEGQLRVSTATRRLDAYDVRTGVWTRMADMPGRRAAQVFEAIGDRLYVAGGVGDDDRSMWVYDVAADSWTVVEGPTRREHLGGAVSGGKLYVIAGRGFGLGDRSGILERFDPQQGTWERLDDMPGACGGCAAAATADGRVHVTGGETFGAARETYRDHYVYDPRSEVWTVAEPMPTARHGIGAAAVGERFYVVGGGLIAGLDYSTVVEWWAPAVESGPTETVVATETVEAAETEESPDGFVFVPCVRR